MFMADIFGEILSTELSLMLFVSIAAWILIFIYLYYTNSKLKKFEQELESLKDEN
jgi:CcmD family protein